jgi:hypothetical protein
MSEKDATTKAKSIDTDSLKKAVETINTMKAKMQDKKAEILTQVEAKKKEYEELAILYRELFGPLPWDSQPKKKGGKGTEYMVIVKKGDEQHEIKGKGWATFGDSIYNFLNTPEDLRNKVVWSGNWNGLRDALLHAGYLIVSTNW